MIAKNRESETSMDFFRAISLWKELLSYETLWGLPHQTLRTIAELFRSHDGLPSEVLEAERLRQRREELLRNLEEIERDVEVYLTSLIGQFSVSVHRGFSYPDRLRDSRYPVELLYYRGDIEFVDSRAVSVVGARKCSPEGAKRAAKLARGLVEAGFTVVSGLAAGIDTAAMTAAIVAGGRTIGVIGTPIIESYPKENSQLQEQVAREHLLVSQVPFYRYKTEPFPSKKRYFPERNVTMAALSLATVVVEASETSGTHTQARACLAQGRKLFILNSCFESGLKWPHTYLEQGAIRVHDMSEIVSMLGSGATNDGGQNGDSRVDAV